MKNIVNTLDWLENRVQKSKVVEKVGRVIQATGLIIESDGPEVSVGQIVTIEADYREKSILAEVVGFKENRVLLMPLEDIEHIHSGCKVIASNQGALVPCGENLLGRVIDGMGQPMDELGTLRTDFVEGLHSAPPNPMKRKIIEDPFETTVKSIDAFIPIGQGQRVGVFAGSGVGKSTLLGMIARGSEADVNVIALVGERGRELREFIENDLGPEGLKKSIVVVSTSDQSAPLRLRAAFMATRIAEEFREKGKKVLLLMDSVTRIAMAQREIGLAVGEPPTSRGYTPSVFSVLPKLLERSGTSSSGSITAIYTVLVEGDDFNEPVADAVRGILDGHIILSRDLATSNFYPAIDVLQSVSRLNRALLSASELENVSRARDLLSLYKDNEDLINIGAYVQNSNPKLDQAIEKYPYICDFLKQPFSDKVSRNVSLEGIGKIVS